MKKILSVVLTIALLLAILPTGIFGISANAATEYSYDYYTYTVSNGEATITDCDTIISGKKTIPSTLGGYPVTSIGSSAFENCKSLTSITIPDSVTSIGDSAFKYCYDLTSITIPNSVTSIGDDAFGYCDSLTSITIPNSVTSIGDYAFYGCTSLKDVYYSGSYVDRLNIEIGSNNTNLTSATWHYKDNEQLAYSYNEDDFTATVTDCDLKATVIIIPQTVTKDGKEYVVTSIGEDAFRDCASLTSITIPNSVTSIGNYAFYSCTSLTSITIPNGVTSIGERAFYNCTNLTSITIPNSFTSIGDSAFEGCAGLTSITIPSSVTSIGSYAFDSCTSLTSITIPDSVTSIGLWAFHGCTSLTSITIPDSVTSIGFHTFGGCTSLTCITIPDSVTSIGLWAFHGCTSLTDVYYIGSYGDRLNIEIGSDNTNLTSATWHYSDPLAFDYDDEDLTTTVIDCHLKATEVIIPETVTKNGKEYVVTSIGEDAFRDCASLTSITIPDSVTSIGAYAFYNCTNLKDVYYIGAYVDYLNIEIGKYNTNFTSATRYYSDPLVYSYNEDDCTATVTVCCSTATEVIIPETVTKDGKEYVVTSIGKDAFWNCTSLTSITIPNSVTSIGSSAFNRCYSLKSITIPNGVTSIGSSAFRGCSSLASITIPNGVTSIGSFAFSDCYNLTSITIPDSVTYIGDSVFYYCYSLSSITVDSNNKHYVSENDVLFNISKTEIICYPARKTATSYTVPNSVTTIDSYAFMYCDCLTSITIPNSVTSIGDSAFYYCDSLKNVYYMGSVSDKENIFIDSSNDELTSANWYYNSCVGTAVHTYTNVCDTECNIEGCGYNREAPHAYEWVTDKENNCSIDGKKHEECTVCHTTRNENTAIPATGNHTYSHDCDAECNVCELVRDVPDHVFDNACDTTCNVVGCEYTRTITHNYEWIIDKENNCGVDGYKHEECTVCHTTRNENTVINATGNHSFEWVIDTENTCGDDGYKHEECTVCHTTRNENTVISATGDHTYSHDCDAECNVCEFVRDVPDHIFDNACDTTCNVVGCDYTRTITHNYEWVTDKENNCGVDGYKHEECTVCHTTRNENTVISATGNHTYSHDCDAECNVCEFVRDVPDHVFDNACDTDCNAEGCSHTREITHDYEWVIDEENTCGKDGKKHQECTVCNAVQNENTVIPATGEHTYDNACDAECNVCKQIRNVPDHVYTNACDAECNICETERDVPDHVYDSDIDPDCNVCEDVREITYTGWYLDSSTWLYYENGEKATGWQFVGNFWYYFNTDGIMQTGWLLLGNTWYFLADGGNMVTGWQHIGNFWYYFHDGGNMATGWLNLGGTWYFLADGGNMVTGWQRIGNFWYYFHDGGNMATGWLSLGGTWYYMAEGGNMVTGWLLLSGTWYYFADGGNMLTGWQYLGGTWYLFADSGAWIQ